MSEPVDSFELGSVFWAKVGSHPWWPCMVYYTPDGESFIRNTHRGACYHVQFLGPLVERAWVYPNNLIPFNGKKKFDEYVQEKLKACKDKNEKSKFDSKSTSSSRNIWVQSWREAEEAMNMPPDKRIEKFGKITVDKSRHISQTEENELLKLMANVPLTAEEEAEALETYVHQESESRIAKTPDLDRVALEEELKAQWPAFDISTKRSYLQNKLGLFQSSAQSDRPKRKSSMSIEFTPKSCLKKAKDETSGIKTHKKKPTDGSAKSGDEPRELDIEIHRLIVSPAQYRWQPVCPACEVYSNVPGQMVKCLGPCGRLVHPSCMRYKTPPPPDNNRPDKFKCSECLSGDYLCTVCGKPADPKAKGNLNCLYLCPVRDCGRHFHRECVLEWPGTVCRPSLSEHKTSRSSAFQLIRCPAHCCQTCWLERDPSAPQPTTSETPLLQCVRCPAAFHTGDLCTPAGSAEVSLSHIVCPRHYEDTLVSAHGFKTQHPNWCFQCFNTIAADKVLCQTCPATYHKECSQSAPNDGNFICQSCRNGVFPRYAQIIWAKIMHFRWWPCEIIHARNAPINILNMTHPEGTFPVHFLGSDEYQWVARGAVLPYEIGLKSSAAKDSHGTKSVEKAFTRALKRAPKAYQLYVNHVLKRGLPLTSMHADPLPDEELLPPASMEADVGIHPSLEEESKALALAELTPLHSSIFPEKLWPKLHKLITSRVPSSPCSCATSSSTNTMCSNKSGCIHVRNRADCASAVCSFGTKDCGNRRFAQMLLTPETDRVTLFRTVNRGFGLKANKSFKSGDLVTEYVGEIITLDDANKRILEALGPNALANISSSRKGFQPLAETYLARLSSDLDFVVDAHKQGNLSRFINHSCEPNLLADSWLTGEKPHVGLFALKTIAPNEELTVDYRASQFLSTGLMGAASLCLCGADTCASTLNLPKSFDSVQSHVTDVPVSSQSAINERRKSKAKGSASESPADTNASRGSLNKSRTTNEEVAEQKPQAFSVVSLLAAASTHASARRDRALIQPTTAAARAAMSKAKLPAPQSDIAHDQYTLLGLRPPPHEDFCYRCGDGGELLLCDKSSCPKSFHLNCLGLSSPPSGIWYCPWHYCDQCGHPSTHLCWRCPNSYCLEHALDSKIEVDDLDKERWDLAKTGLNSITSSTIISSFRWICTDHAGMKITGPGHRPQLADSDKKPTGKGIKTTKGMKETTENLVAEEIENVQPGIVPKGEAERRVEPLKVTLKRKLKTEMFASANETSSSPNDASPKTTAVNGIRKRPSVVSPALDKKRPRLHKDSLPK
ncbi:Histone-lysine N-methyltransferase nsd3 [Clonorchis sinensis]|uniref:Histone-lysine N-methyltransferase nsd3 n=1 Tax=Clonorchis sinensis TaxID=79923 RepID=A0A8T1MRC7_CLOSI|nr:Histone-lysine N-methyltransferase nsd3 [Clonorchis sinensis]